MAGEDSTTTSGYYTSRNPTLLMRRVEPKHRTAKMVWKTRDQIIVPRKFRQEIMQVAHEPITAGHQGSNKTLARITNRFFWPGIKGDVKRFCRSCGPCQRAGKGTKMPVAPLKPLPIIKEPFAFVSADFVGPLPRTPRGNRYILNFIDHSTKYVESFPSPTATARDVERALTEVISRHGKPLTLLTDRGS